VIILGPSEEEQKQWNWAASFNKKIKQAFSHKNEDADEADRLKRRELAKKGVHLIGPM